MFLAIILTSSFSQAQYKIESVIPQKGYILSIDLAKKQCEKIWSKQISIFKKNNPHIKDPNVLSIGKEIQVQNCMKEIQSQAPLNQEQNQKQVSVKKDQKASQKSGFFISIGKELNSIDKKDSDEGKHGSGIRFDIGKRFYQKESSEIKTSLGIILNETNTDSDLKIEKKLLSLNIGYLYSLGSRIKIGPNAEILYNSVGATFKNQPDRKSLNPYIGINGDIFLSKDLFLDLKIGKSLNDRLDFVNSISIGIDF